MTSRIVVGDSDAAWDQRLSNELDAVNALAIAGPAAVELTVWALDAAGELLGDISG